MYLTPSQVDHRPEDYAAADAATDTDCPDCGGSGIEWPKMRYACPRCGGSGVVTVGELTDDERDERAEAIALHLAT